MLGGFVAWGKWHCTEVGREDNYAILDVELHVRGRYKQKGQKKEKESKKNACGDIENDREAWVMARASWRVHLLRSKKN